MSRSTKYLGLPVAVGVMGLVLLQPAGAVTLDGERHSEIVLDDGTVVTLVPEARKMSRTGAAPPPIAASVPQGWPVMPELQAALGASGPSGRPRTLLVAPWVGTSIPCRIEPTRYYYLPTNLRLARRPDGTPEFLFINYTTEERVEEGGAQGGLLHFLMEWGLTKSQQQELEAKLQEADGRADLAGAAPLEYMDETGSFDLVSGVLGDGGGDDFTYSVATSGRAPLVPGGRAAVAARLSPQAAQLLATSFEETSSISDIDVVLNYACSVMMPAVKGRVTIHWDKLAAEYENLSAEYRRWESGRKRSQYRVFGISIYSSDKPSYSYSYDELEERYKFLVEQKIVDVELETFQDNEATQRIEAAFLDYFVQTMTNQEGDADALPPPPNDGDGNEGIPDDIRTGGRYSFNRTAIDMALQRKTQVITLNARRAVRRPIQLVANVTSWYDAVRDNPKCVSTVNLNDPFFDHRDINFIVDLDAKDMFSEGINYVTVNVRKRRNQGNDYERSLTIDADYIAKQGLTATRSYAREGDTNSDVYEYQVQWSLRGGLVFPKNPPWQQGQWEGVTLSPPVAPRTIELEANLSDMEASDITRVTAQIRYRKFEDEVETNIHVSPAQGEALVSKKIFVDRGTRGYAYRLVLNHKTLGKLALPWQAKVNDDYIYAGIPEDLLEEPAYKEAAEEMETAATKAVLDRFKELEGGTNNEQ